MTRTLSAGFVVLFLSRLAIAQGYPPAEAASHMKVPDGLEVKLFASEPMIRQPVCIEFDDRGRMWVIQYLQYPNPAGLKRVSVDRYSRTVYDKMPEPPPKGVKGADRITILEDSDGDGTPDKSKAFVDGLNIASGLAFGHGGVFVLNPPYLLFYPDKNRDDVPDGDPDVLLTGFGLEDCHSVANSLTWGPDGWLYGCQGSTVTANIRGVEFQQGVWRYHPPTKKFELFCEGGGNSWGMDFDRHGNLLYNTNFGGFVMLHAVQGAYYWKSFGKHGPLHNPFAYGYFDHVPHKDFQGGHVENGGVIYEGDGLPEQYHGKWIANDLLGHAIRVSSIEPAGSSFKSANAGELLTTTDTWFAPCDLTMGPDGALYTADWSDKRTAHPDPDAEWDRSNGRVYRISIKGKKFDPGPDYSKLKSEELIAMLAKTDNRVSRKARQELAKRRDGETFEPLKKIIAEGDANSRLALEAIWALYVGGGLSEEFATTLLSHPNPDIRRWTIRVLGDEEKVSPAIAKRFAELAASDPDIHVRSQLASTAKRLKPGDTLPIVEQLINRDVDATDPHIPLLLWWAVERHCLDGRERVETLLRSSWKSKLARDMLIPLAVRRYTAEGTPEAISVCHHLLESAPNPGQTRSLLKAMDQGLGERSRPLPGALSKGLASAIRMSWDEKLSTDVVLIRLLARLGERGGLERARSIALDPGQPAEVRAPMVGILGEFGRTNELPALLGILGNAKETDPVRLATLSALQRVDDDRIATAVLAGYSTYSPAVRPHAIDLLIGRLPWTMRLLKAVDKGLIAPADVSMDQLRQVSLHHDYGLNQLVQKHWGKITGGTTEERLADVRRFNNDIRAAAGDAKAGRELFKATCAVCHKLNDEGSTIGPDLTHANRGDREYLLVSIVDPNAYVRAEYLSYLVKTTDGRVLNGLVVEQSAASVTLADAKGERITIERAKIKEMKESPVSLMPEGLLAQFKPQQLRDLFAYLQNTGK